MTDRVLSDLRGTRKSSFAIDGEDISSASFGGQRGLKIENANFWGDGKGSMGPIYDLGSVSSGTPSFDFANDGLRQKIRLSGSGPFTFTSSFPVNSCIATVVIENDTLTNQTPSWSAHFHFGESGTPTIPPAGFCTVILVFDHDLAVFHCTHNCMPAGITETETGIRAVGGGLLGVVIDPGLTSAQIRSFCTGTYDYSGADDWQLWVSPTPTSGIFTLDVWVRSFGNQLPAPADSVCAAAYPTLTGNGTDFTASGATSAWTGSLVRGDMVTVAATVNTAGVKWWALYIPARRTF